jgi:alkylation response protein AidB-like acyl-CoA dehydrogenase
LNILDKRDDPEAFRAALRQWLAATVPPDWRERMTHASPAEFRAFQQWWLAQLDSVGLATPHWPVEWGGHALDLTGQAVIFEEMARANAPDPVMFTISFYHLPATLAAWGTPEQQQKYLPGVRKGAVWCQGFSEPGAGSDLAALRTRAVRDGDRYIVNGQKVWSSYGAYADYYLLLARTDPDAPKHKGISCFIVDLKSPGVDIRPISQINGHNEFCEVFLDNVSVPAENLIGPENEGWRVAQSTLSAERGVLIFALAERMNLLLERLIAEPAPKWAVDDQTRREFIACYADMQSVRRLIRSLLAASHDDESAGALPPIIKVLYGETFQRLTELMTRIEGVDSQVVQPTFISGGYAKAAWMVDYLSSWVWTISGGSNEVLRNVIAERQLGLPREPKAA